MKKILLFIAFNLAILSVFGQKKTVNVDSILEINIFKLAYTNIFNGKRVIFNNSKYSVGGIYCLVKNQHDESLYKTITKYQPLSEDESLYRVIEIYLNRNDEVFDKNNCLLVEVTELIENEKLKRKKLTYLPRYKSSNGKFYYKNLEPAYKIYDNGLIKRYGYKPLIISNIEYIDTNNRFIKIKLENRRRLIKYNRKTFLEQNGVILNLL